MVSSGHFERVAELFAAAVDLPADQRTSYLSQRCGDDAELRREVEELIVLDERAPLQKRIGALDDQLGQLAVGVTSHADALPPGAQIGGYRILGELGRGGMGIVYRAEQAQPRRTVALKLIRSVLDDRLLRRFEQEAEVLGLLHHPGIAQIFEASTARTHDQSAPFFAMELVEGEVLTEFATRRSLDINDRVRLLVAIGDALQHAHQKGVIHRDLKPANVLVTREGQPKILDFGVARATDADLRGATLQTDAWQILGTLAYMSPEQVRGEPKGIDTRSDVYALGVVAYELLTGELPYEVGGSLPEAARVITEREPVRLGNRSRLFRGDLETIIGKALQKDRRMRYASASEFVADLQRFLHHEPIEARNPSTIYQLEKFARRHRGLVTGLLIAVLILVGAVIGMTHLMLRAVDAEQAATQLAREEETQRRDAERSRDIAAAVNEFLHRMLGAPDPWQENELARHDVTVAAVLDSAATELDDGFDELDDVQAEIRTTLGATYLGIGEFRKAVEQLARAHELQQELHGERSKKAAVVLRSLIEATVKAGDLDRAEELSRELVPLHAEVMGPGAEETLLARFARLEVMFAHNALDDAAAFARETLDVAEEARGSDDELTVRARGDLGLVLLNLGQLDEAEALQREALAACRARYEDPHPHTLAVLNSLTGTLWRKGRAAEAEEVARELVAGRTELLGPGHAQTLNALNGLIVFLNSRRAYDESDRLRAEQLTAARVNLGDEHPLTLSFRHNAANTLWRRRRLDQAEAECTAVVAARLRVLPAGHEQILLSQELLGLIQRDQGRPAEAEATLRQAAETARQSMAKDHWLPPWLDVQLARCLADLKRYDEAKALLVAAEAALREKFGAENSRTRSARRALGHLRRRQSK
ncbi:MAG: serine/threonine-protein kinase [Planctomycetota bacterium]